MIRYERLRIAMILAANFFTTLHHVTQSDSTTVDNITLVVVSNGVLILTARKLPDLRGSTDPVVECSARCGATSCVWEGTQRLGDNNR